MSGQRSHCKQTEQAVDIGTLLNYGLLKEIREILDVRNLFLLLQSILPMWSPLLKGHLLLYLS